MNEFDHRPDARLGQALREALSYDDDHEFARRVIAALPTASIGEAWWDILGEWARPGIAAAAAVLVAVTIWLAGQQPGLDTPDSTLAEISPAQEVINPGAMMMATGAVPEFQVDMVLGEERVNE